MSDMNLKIRYGRVKNRVPKNTLVTLSIGDMVYFGISRCNFKVGDIFRKNIGKDIAIGRAKLAVKEAHKFGHTDMVNLKMHTSGLRGQVGRKHIGKLISLFNYIDDIATKYDFVNI